jgi:hypothetical protein
MNCGCWHKGKGLATRQTVGIWLSENGSFCGKLAIFVANACFLRHSRRTFCLIFLILAPRSYTLPTPPPTPTRARGTFWRHSGSAAAHRPGPPDHVTHLGPISSAKSEKRGKTRVLRQTPVFCGKLAIFVANARFSSDVFPLFSSR